MDQITDVMDEAYVLFTHKEYNNSLEKLTLAESLLNNKNTALGIPRDKMEDTLASVNNFKGFNYLAINNLTEAKACFEQSLNLNPNSSQACAGLAEILFINKKDIEAKIMFEWAIDNNPLNKFAINGLAKVNQALGLPDEHNTLNVDTSLLKEAEDFFNSLRDAFTFFQEKKFSNSYNKLCAAEKYLQEHVVSKTNATKAAGIENFKGFNCLALERLDEAKICFEKALNINPSSSQACAGLGEVYYLQGYDEQAKTMFEWAIINNMENEFAKAGLRKINRLLGYEPNHNSLES
jgi:tetratricopeptide (TPR) repeat protein